MMKRLLSFFMVLMLLMPAALAQEAGTAREAEENEGAIYCAASLPDWDSLKRYASFEQEGTVWLVRSNQAQAALVQMGWDYAPYDGYVCFGLELTGDSETGVTVPVLAFYYDGTQPLNARAASISVGGVRYDFLLCREEMQVDKAEIERLTAPLNAQGLDMIRAMIEAKDEAEEVQVWLQGDVTYEMKIDTADENYGTIREELAARSMNALSDMLREFDAIDPYELWDLNEAWWTRTKGVQPQMRKTTLSDGESITVCGVTLESPMQMISRGAIDENVRALQKLLISAGFLQGSADGAYGAGTVRAVEAAQRWFLLPATGSADELLVHLLSGEDVCGGDSDVQPDAEKAYAAQGVCELSLSRFWFADAVESAGGDRRSVLDKDDTMIIYEGSVKNLSAEDLDFYWQMSATAYCGEYEYPCVLVCERNEGNSLTSYLPPLGEARLLIYAEIPETAIGMGEWHLEIKAGESTFRFE